jgi:hypothetical protein
MFKKKGMIDVGEMQRRGMVIAPKRDPSVDKFKMGKDGYVELRKDVANPSSDILSSLPASESSSTDFISSPSVSQDSSAGFPGFFDFNANASNSPSSSISSDLSSSSSSNIDVYEKREVDERVEKLDNLIYKLEQRILELEKKLGVSGSSW